MHVVDPLVGLTIQTAHTTTDVVLSPADAQLGDNVAHMRQTASQFIDDIIVINEKFLLSGQAPPEYCNRRIDAMRLALHLQCELSGVRQRLMTLFPDGLVS